MGEASTELLEWLRPEFQVRQGELIHLAQAAKIAGVTRACVSNWHRRHESFRELIAARHRDGGQRRSVYLPEVEFRAWLDERPDRADPVPGGASPRGVEGKRLAAQKAKNYHAMVAQRLAQAEETVRNLRKELRRAKKLEAQRSAALAAQENEVRAAA